MPPLPPTDCARMATERSPAPGLPGATPAMPVWMLPVSVTATAPALPPAAPDPPIATEAEPLWEFSPPPEAEAAKAEALPPLPPPPPIDWAMMP